MLIKPRAHSSNRAEAEVLVGEQEPVKVFIDSSVAIAGGEDFWIPLLLPIAMKLKTDIHIQGTLSEELMRLLPGIQNLLSNSHSYFSKIQVTSDHISCNPKFSEARGTAIFFSGGLDSTFSAISMGPSADLIAVHGFDIPIENTRHWELSLESINAYALAMGHKVFEIRTNIREFSDKYSLWGMDYFGSALSGLAHLIAGEYELVLASSGVSEKITRWGAFPKLFESYSTSNLKILDHGLESRIAKAKFVDNHGLSKNIRVCWQNLSGLVNCGSCAKCIRTRFEFELANCRLFPAGLEDKFTLFSLIKFPLSKIDSSILHEDLTWLKVEKIDAPAFMNSAIAFARARGLALSLVRKFTPKWLKSAYRMMRKSR